VSPIVSAVLLLELAKNADPARLEPVRVAVHHILNLRLRHGGSRENTERMTSRISHTSFDAIDPYAQSLFWSGVLGYVQDGDDPNRREDEECAIMAPDRSQVLLFIRVPDAKEVKNRVHLDLRPRGRSGSAEGPGFGVERRPPTPGRQRLGHAEGPGR
jgi:hypothetical protein